MSDVELIEQSHSLIDGLDGYWSAYDTYLLSTPQGYMVVFYTDGRVVMRIIIDGHCDTRLYENVKSKKHAVTLAKRFYRDLMK